MKKMLFLLAIPALVALPGAAMAYVGPGAGLSLLGALWALLAAAGLAVLLVVAWPLRRFLRRRRVRKAAVQQRRTEAAEGAVRREEPQELRPSQGS